MRVNQLLEALDLRGTGAEAAGELELEELRRDPDFERCKDETLSVLSLVVGAMMKSEESERQAGLRPEGLAKRRKEWESNARRLKELSPKSTA